MPAEARHHARCRVKRPAPESKSTRGWRRRRWTSTASPTSGPTASALSPAPSSRSGWPGFSAGRVATQAAPLLCVARSTTRTLQPADIPARRPAFTGLAEGRLNATRQRQPRARVIPRARRLRSEHPPGRASASRLVSVAQPADRRCRPRQPRQERRGPPVPQVPTGASRRIASAWWR
jgi:hypothetical protein